jgi:hypothetical protein
LQYVGGDEDMSEIDMDRISLLEVKGHLIEGISDRVLFFGSLRNDFSMDWCVLYIDSGCAKMANFVCVSGVAEIYVECHREEDGSDDSSCAVILRMKLCT